MNRDRLSAMPSLSSTITESKPPKPPPPPSAAETKIGGRPAPPPDSRSRSRAHHRGNPRSIFLDFPRIKANEEPTVNAVEILLIPSRWSPEVARAIIYAHVQMGSRRSCGRKLDIVGNWLIAGIGGRRSWVVAEAEVGDGRWRWGEF
ncbi:hypothetical protein ACS0TY_023884 [Phlomoides rotata]